jgi:hypothetical protein
MCELYFNGHKRMTDEPDNASEDVEIAYSSAESSSEFIPWSAPSGKGGLYIFPLGVEAWATQGPSPLLHIDQSTGALTIQMAMFEQFRDITKSDCSSSVTKLKGA